MDKYLVTFTTDEEVYGTVAVSFRQSDGSLLTIDCEAEWLDPEKEGVFVSSFEDRIDTV